MQNRPAALPRTPRLPMLRPLTLAGAALGLAGVLLSGGALADSRSAGAKMFANLARTGSEVGVTSAEAVIEATLVRGMYSIHNQQGKFISFTNESGSVVGDAKGFYVVPASGAPLRMMTGNEKDELRREFMGNIDYDKLVRVSAGDGGGRRLVLFSAIDCPSCADLEGVLAKSLRQAPTTIYVVPSSLNTIRDGGLASWENVTRLWCADNNGRSWQKYWQTRAVPAARQCAITAQSAERLSGNLKALFNAVDLPMLGVPRMLREDGHPIELPGGYDAGFALSLGRMGTIPSQAVAPKWLAADNMVSDNPDGAVTARQTGQSPGQQSGKIKASDLLKKLFK
jgi:hypothetical protein